MKAGATRWDWRSAGVEGDLAEVRGGSLVEQGAGPHPPQPRRAVRYAYEDLDPS